MPEFGHGASARVQGRDLVLGHSDTKLGTESLCEHIFRWFPGTLPTNHLFLYPQFPVPLKECEHIFRLGTMCLNKAPFCAGARALVPGHQV